MGSPFALAVMARQIFQYCPLHNTGGRKINVRSSRRQPPVFICENLAAGCRKSLMRTIRAQNEKQKAWKQQFGSLDQGRQAQPNRLRIQATRSRLPY
jgi:hypothetical protein